MGVSKLDSTAIEINQMGIEDQIKDYISMNILFSDTKFGYGDSVSFLQEGIIDSVGVMELVSFVGNAFSITVAPQDVTPDNFDSVSALANYIRRKSNASK